MMMAPLLLLALVLATPCSAGWFCTDSTRFLHISSRMPTDASYEFVSPPVEMEDGNRELARVHVLDRNDAFIEHLKTTLNDSKVAWLHPDNLLDLCEAYYAGPTGANYSYQALVELRDYRNLQFLMSDLAVLAFDRAAKFAGERRGDGVHLQNITELDLEPSKELASSCVRLRLALAHQTFAFRFASYGLFTLAKETADGEDLAALWNRMHAALPSHARTRLGEPGVRPWLYMVTVLQLQRRGQPVGHLDLMIVFLCSDEVDKLEAFERRRMIRLQPTAQTTVKLNAAESLPVALLEKPTCTCL